MADMPNWVFHRHATTLQRYLSTDFDFSLRFYQQPFREDDYDLIYALEFCVVAPELRRNPRKYLAGMHSYASDS